MEFLDGLVTSYPGASALFAFLLIGVVAYMGTTLKWFVKREFARMEAHETTQDEAIEHIEERLNEYDITFAVSKSEFKELVDKIDAHLLKESSLPVAVAQIATDVAWIKSTILKRQNGTQ